MDPFTVAIQWYQYRVCNIRIACVNPISPVLSILQNRCKCWSLNSQGWYWCSLYMLIDLCNVVLQRNQFGAYNINTACIMAVSPFLVNRVKQLWTVVTPQQSILETNGSNYSVVQHSLHSSVTTRHLSIPASLIFLTNLVLDISIFPRSYYIYFKIRISLTIDLLGLLVPKSRDKIAFFIWSVTSCVFMECNFLRFYGV